MHEVNHILVFDRVLVRRHQDRAAASFARHSVLFEEMATQIIDRLGDVKREFKAALDLGSHKDFLSRHLIERKIPFVVSGSLSEPMARQTTGLSVVADEEFLPFAPDSFDLIVSNLSMHWVNDLPGALLQLRKILRPDGLFMATVFGENTLCELRSCLLEAELAVTGGISPRLSPTASLRDMSALLQRAGFTLPVTDQESVTLTYPDAFALMYDLRGMGETNAHRHRQRSFTRPTILREAAKIYHARYGSAEGQIPATFDVLFLHGWAPMV